jgi:hypothetical protein
VSAESIILVALIYIVGVATGWQMRAAVAAALRRARDKAAL